MLIGIETEEIGDLKVRNACILGALIFSEVQERKKY